MSIMNEKINSLNQIIEIIDQKAASYKKDRHHMASSRAVTEKKLIIDLINDANKLALTVIPKPIELINDLARLKNSL